MASQEAKSPESGRWEATVPMENAGEVSGCCNSNITGVVRSELIFLLHFSIIALIEAQNEISILWLI
jgi:hypothetical protein